MATKYQNGMVYYITRLCDSFKGNDFVGLDTTHSTAVNISDVHREEHIGSYISYYCFNRSHFLKFFGMPWCMRGVCKPFHWCMRGVCKCRSFG